MKRVLVCKHCNQKIFYVLEELIPDVTILRSDLFKPYSRNIKQPIDNIDEFACPLCRSSWAFNPGAINIIEEE